MALISRHRQTCGPPLPPSAGFGCSGPFHVFHLVIQTRCQNHPTPHPALLSSLDPAINDSILSSTERYEREVTAVGDTLIPTKPTTPKQNKNKTPTRYIHHVYEALLCLDGFSDQNRPPLIANCSIWLFLHGFLYSLDLFYYDPTFRHIPSSSTLFTST